MEATQLLRAILPDMLIDNFDIAGFEKSDVRFGIYLDEKKIPQFFNYDWELSEYG